MNRRDFLSALAGLGAGGIVGYEPRRVYSFVRRPEWTPVLDARPRIHRANDLRISFGGVEFPTSCTFMFDGTMWRRVDKGPLRVI